MISKPAKNKIALIGAPVDAGGSCPGCLMGPAALRIASLEKTLSSIGHEVKDQGDLSAIPISSIDLGPHVKDAAEVSGWTRELENVAYDTLSQDNFPIFMGGDHSLAMGTLSGVTRYAADAGRPQFVLWLDAHADFNAPETSASGNMHGMPLAFACGLPGFGDILPATRAMVPPENVYLFGVRSIDSAERAALEQWGVNVFDMRVIDEEGVGALMQRIIETVSSADGLLHVSFDVDFLDPEIAPGVGTMVPGGATFREAHLVMEMLSDARLATSLDLAELNPSLDDRGKSARLMVELTASLFGLQVFDRPTRAGWQSGGMND